MRATPGLRRVATRGNCDLPDRWGDTVLMLAAGNSECNNEALWEQLIQLADPTCADKLANSCLHRAASSGNSAAAFALLDSGASANSRSRSQFTPLMLAAVRALPAAAAAVSRVLLDAGSDWSQKNRNGRTSLDLASQKGKSKLAGLLRGYEGKKYFDEPLALPCPFLERWDTDRLIGTGGFGDVHEVTTDKRIRCAAKTIKLPVQLGDQLDSVRRAIDKTVESEMNLCRLHHENIVRFFFITQTEPANVVVFMELLDGRSLERFLDKKPLDELTVRDFTKQICSALLYMHNQEPPVIHRDINCNNIIVLADRKRLKLIDFGLSIKLEQSVSNISASTPKCTLNFVAPELLGAGETDGVQYSRESDIWAFGCSVFQMVSGARPFANARNLSKVVRQLSERGAPDLPDGSSAELRNFYSRCTAKDPSKRESAKELMGHEFLSFSTYSPGSRPFLERWDSVRLIVRGSFGDIHEVSTDKGLRCAAKTIKLPVQLGDQNDLVSRAIDKTVESEMNLCRLHHENIVSFFFITQTEPANVVVFMELLEGRSLERLLDKKPLDELTVREFTKQICSALLYMHNQEPPVIHRDINCTNIIVLADSRRLKLINFGLSIKLEQSVGHISASTPKCTLNFVAPELLGAGESDSVQYSRESDIWAFGCSVFQMASGAKPFANAKSLSALVRQLNKEGAPALPHGSSAELRDFYSLCTAKDRSERKPAKELMGHEFLNVRLDDDFYPVTDLQGFCLIINVCKYRKNCKRERTGSEHDVARAKQVFERLRFTVIVKKDLKAEEIDNFLNDIKQSKELAKHGSFVCFLMSHGCQDAIYGSDGVSCKIPELTAKFESNKCRGLAGKPKIFFIQACRGNHSDRVVVDGEATDDDRVDPPRGLTVGPPRADFVICYATTEGQISYRNEVKGSFFVQALCEKIEEYHKREDLLRIMTRVKRHMAENPVRDQDGAESFYRMGQTVQQLTRNVSFDLSRAQKL